jgi:hypothetical protein
MPVLAIACFTSSLASTWWTALVSLSTTGFGVPAGSANPYQLVTL